MRLQLQRNLCDINRKYRLHLRKPPRLWKTESSCILQLQFFSVTITNLSVLAGHHVKPPKYVKQSHFNLQLGQSHAHAAAWPRSKRQIHKWVPAGLGFWSEPETNTEFIVSTSHGRHANNMQKDLCTAC